MRPRRRPALAAAGLAAACSDATSPEASVAGTYELESYDGRLVTFVQTRVAGLATVEVYDGYLDLRSDRTFTADVRTRTTNLQTGAATIASDPISGRFTVQGGVIPSPTPPAATWTARRLR